MPKGIRGSFEDLTGQIFGQLLVKKQMGKDKHGNRLWLCLCVCGGTALTRAFMLKGGRTRSCGCIQKLSAAKRCLARVRVIQDTLICTRCRTEKPISQYGLRRDHGVERPKSHCYTCAYDYKRRNMPKIISRTRARKSWVKKATPKWANIAQIDKKYAEAAFLTMITGIKHHVDHVIPLRGKTVSGLHLAYNLQVIPWRNNLCKGISYQQEYLK